MPVHPFDFEIQSGTFSTPELAAVFDEQARFSRWLRFEAVLAKIQARLGLIPPEAAAEIAARAELRQLDLEEIRLGYTRSRNSLIPLLDGLRRACRNGGGEYVHYGATTQDVLDTGQILELKEGLNIIYRDLRRLEQTLHALARRYRHTPMIGRTHGQQALPITFGFKVAVWLMEIRRHLERLKSLAPRLLVGELSGAVGTRAALGPRADELAAAVMTELGLGFAPFASHTARDNIAELSGCFAMLTATLAKIANEIIQLGKTEVGELSEPSFSGGSSSTMPHKKNPVLCQRICVAASHVRALNGTVLEGMVHEHERDPRSLWSEWLAIPQIVIYTGTAVHYVNTILTGLEVHTDRMTANLGLHGEAALSEWLLFRLAPGLGRQNAHARLRRLLEQAAASGRSLADTIRDDPEITQLLNEKDLEQLSHPERYTGSAEATVAAVCADIEARRETDPEVL